MRRFAFILLVICMLVSMVFIVSVSAAPATAWRTRTPTRTKTPSPVKTFTPTPTRSVTVTPNPTLPDLLISSAYWVYDPNAYDSTNACYRYTPVLLFKVTVKNNGGANAGAFVVDQDGLRQQTVTSLAAGQTVDLWFPFIFGTPPSTTWPQGSAVFTADYTNTVAEGNEGNNSLTVPKVAFTATPSGGPTRVYCAPTPTATRTLTPTPTAGQSPVTGSVVVADGACCVGGTAGSTINIPAAFSASSSAGAVTQMRVTSLYGGGCVSQISSAWEPFVASKSFPVTVAINWIGFYVSVQYRDAGGNLSPVYCDDVSVEGMPAQTTTTRTPTSTAIPGADFTGTPLSGTAPLAVQFTHINSSVLSSCTWNFGDGSSQNYAPGGSFSTCPSVSHTYAAAGSYTVSLSVMKTTGQGNTMSKPGYIQVSAAITPTPRPGCGTVVVATLTPTPTFTRTPSAATATATTCGPIYVTPTRTTTLIP